MAMIVQRWRVSGNLLEDQDTANSDSTIDQAS